MGDPTTEYKCSICDEMYTEEFLNKVPTENDPECICNSCAEDMEEEVD